MSDPEPPPAISWRGVSKSFGAVPALDALDLEARAGECLCLVGPSGCGKTTLLRLVNRLEEPSAGTVDVRGTSTLAWDPIELRRSLGYVIQSGGLLPHLTIARNVGLVPEVLGWEPDRIAVRVDELLTRVHLDPGAHRERFPHELSGGQRQRVGIARALALDPDVLLLDEPFSALDAFTRRELQDEFAELVSGARRTLVFVTHDPAEAFRLGDRIAVLEHGRLVQVATPADLCRAPAEGFVARFVEALDA